MKPRIERQIRQLPDAIRRRAIEALEQMVIDPRHRRPGFDCGKLAGDELWKVRVGDWRILYAIRDVVRVVEVTKVAPRSTAYR